MVHFPRISIVTPSLNQGEYIEQTILSVINQGYPNLEYIIIDGGSTDNTLEIINKYSDKIHYWVSEKDNGQSNAINKGIKICTGVIFNWINSDDYLEPGALFTIAEYFNRFPSLQLLCGFSNIFHDNAQFKIYKNRTLIYENSEATVFNAKITQPSMFYQLGCIKDIGFVNESLSYVMDLEMWFRFIARFGIINIMMIDDTLTNFRIHSSSKTSMWENKFYDESNQVFLHLFKSLNVNIDLLQYHKSNSKTYISGSWNFYYLKKNRFHLYLAQKHLFDFYKNNYYSAARKAFLYLLSYGKIKFSRKYLSIFIRIFITQKKFSLS